MSYFSKTDIENIKAAADGRLQDVIEDYIQLRRSGKDYIGDCPHCGAKGKFSFSPGKKIFKCWSCNEAKGTNAIAFLMSVIGMDYTQSLETLANKFNVLLEEKPQKKSPAEKKMKKGSKGAKGKAVDTFCARMLAGSGLTYEDVTASVIKSNDNSALFQTPTFKPGTVDQYGHIVEGDDVIIEYYDLDGNPVTYISKYTGAGGKKSAKSEPKEYFRVRWQFPSEHLDRDGEAFKYKSPAGSGTPIYIPNRLRQMFRENIEIPRLYIQEGEKKAEKACKHGIPSIAVSGIQNLGQKGAIPEDLVRIIQQCKVKEVAFIFDSDWNDLSRNIKINKPVDTRPHCFFAAARNFKDYMRMLKNRGIMVEAYVGHINKNQADDKGLDDLLCNTLAGHEEELVQDIDFAVNEKSGTGKYITLYRVTSWSDLKIKSLWSLGSAETFAKAHKSELENLPEFRIGGYSWKFDGDDVVPAEPWAEDEKFWSEYIKHDRNGNAQLDADGNYRYETSYDYVAGKKFFQNKGVGRHHLLDGKFEYIRKEAPFVKKIEVDDARDLMFRFAETFCSKRVNNMLLQGGAQYVGPFQMSRLDYIVPSFRKETRDVQFFYFRDHYWEVTENNVVEKTYESLQHDIWQDQRTSFNGRYVGHRLIEFKKDGDGNYSYELSSEGKLCHFLRFLENSSNFSWRKEADQVTQEDQNENALQLLSKLCAIGFMMMNFKDPNVSRAIVAMDGKQSEVGESNGRSGKSLIGELMRHVKPITYISGKNPNFFNDQFIWNDVDERTQLVFIDDVLQGFNFEMLFACITGDWSVNKKGGIRITYPFERSPKIYIATNHAIKGSGSSFTDRQWLIAFSDFYNDGHKPLDDFGQMFFSEWDFEQWNLCWNMLATCVQLYLQHGVVQAPGDRLEQRKRRQEIGEAIIAFAEEYYSKVERLNTPIPRKEIWDAFKQYDPQSQKYITPTAFKKKLLLYLDWKGLIFNPQKYDAISRAPLFYDRDGRAIIDDKSGGVEYITAGTPDFYTTGLKQNPNDPVDLRGADGKLAF